MVSNLTKALIGGGVLLFLIAPRKNEGDVLPSLSGGVGFLRESAGGDSTATTTTSIFEEITQPQDQPTEIFSAGTSTPSLSGGQSFPLQEGQSIAFGQSVPTELGGIASSPEGTIVQKTTSLRGGFTPAPIQSFPLLQGGFTPAPTQSFPLLQGGFTPAPTQSFFRRFF